MATLNDLCYAIESAVNGLRRVGFSTVGFGRGFPPHEAFQEMSFNGIFYKVTVSQVTGCCGCKAPLLHDRPVVYQNGVAGCSTSCLEKFFRENKDFISSISDNPGERLKLKLEPL